MKFVKGIVNTLFTRKKDEIECHAPFSSMRFNHSGNVLACCYNRGNILGKFPDQSIQDIWFGSNVKDLQDAITKKDFSFGCQSCEKNIVCNNREISGAAQYDYLKNLEQFKNYPTMFDFELGSTCNFECIMCSGEYSTAIRVNREKKKPYYSPYEDNPEMFVDQLTPFIPHLKEMRFIGGEPFLMKVHYQIWDKVIDLNPNIILNVLTNGSILNKRVQTMLEKGNFKISISIDSLVKETYEEIRINGDFDQVMSNINFFLDLMKKRGHTMNFNLCVMRQNWKEIPDYFRYCNENEIQVVLHTVEFPIHCSLWNLSPIELNEIVDFYKGSILENSSSEVVKTNNTTFKALTDQIINWHIQASKKANNIPNEDLESLNNQLIEKLNNERKSSNFKESVNYLGFIMELISNYNTNQKMSILRYLNKIDIRLIIDEINVSSKERILERFELIIQNPDSI